MMNRYDAYRQTSIQTAPPEQLVVMLYDGGIRFLEQAKMALKEGKDASLPIERAQDIILELATSLDRSVGEMAENLARLYDFWIQRLFQASMKKDLDMIEEVCAMMRDLREAWATIALQQRQKQAGGGQQPTASGSTTLNTRG